VAFTLTFPIKEGDECLIVFRRVALISGGRTVGYRKGLTGEFGSVDAFVIPGPQSQAQKISGISTSAAQLRTDDGTAFVEVAAGGAITITSSDQSTDQYR
jgi:hypothetical protein